MELDILQLPKTKLSQLNKAGIYTMEDLLYRLPKKYMDYRTPCNLNQVEEDMFCTMVLFVKLVLKDTMTVKKKQVAYTKLVCEDYYTKKEVTVMWWHNPYKYNEVKILTRMKVGVCGKLKCKVSKGKTYYSFENPEVFTTDLKRILAIHPRYATIKGMAEDYYRDLIREALSIYIPKEVYSEEERKYFNIPSEREYLRMIHKPASEKELRLIQRRYVYENLVFMAKKMVMDANKERLTSTFAPIKLTNTNKMIKAFPYKLTEDQRNIISTFVTDAQKGLRVNALLQGDVGSGKTICAFLLMVAMSDNGYQSALMAPTGILAKQHYEELKRYAEPMGLKAVYMSGDLKAKEKRETLKMIESGEANFVVGTHAVISDSVKFKKLALTIVDEEHKFGVTQREMLKKKAEEGVHNVSMSATPIPRSLALSVYGDSVEIYTIRSMPNGRLPVKTAIVTDYGATFGFLHQEIKEGHQGYIVCPMIDEDEEDNVESVDGILKKTTDYFSYYDKNVKVAAVTGKMKDEEKADIIQRFAKNEIQILIATTIIEVGVNVPNATVMAIMNAERFGLAGLHQLRGRVGRSNLQSYCILRSDDINNERLGVMCDTTDGFVIAQEDLKQRGTGDFLGVRQSGENEQVRLMLKNSKFFESIKAYMKERMG